MSDPLPRLTAGRLALLVAVPLMAAMLAYGLRAAFHSDELNVLLHVERFARGEFRAPGRPGLLWAVLTPLMVTDNPVALMTASRVVAVAVIACGMGCIAVLGRPRGAADSWVDRLLPATAIALVLTSASFAPHAVEVRTDTFTTPLTLLAIVVLWRERWTPKTVALAAVVVAAAILCSQKSAYNAIGLAVAWLLARPAQPGGVSWVRSRGRDAAIAVAVVGGLVVGWYGLLSVLAGTGGDLVSTNLERAASTAFANTVPWEDKTKWLAQAVQRAPLLYGASAVGLLVSAWRAWRGPQDGRVLASALVGATMLGVIAVHRGFFPYYIASIEPLLALPAALAVLTAADGVGRVLEKARVPRGLTVAALTLAMLGGALHHQLPVLKQAWAVTNAGQYELSGRVHRIFGGPVPYIGGLNIIPGYAETAGYLTADARLAKRKQDRTFIATKMSDGARFFVRAYMTRDVYLKRAEKKTLYTSYLPVSPNLYVHGARVRWTEGGTDGHRVAPIYVDGAYTVRVRGESTPELRVNGAPVTDGQVLTLSRGDIALTVGPADAVGEAWLVLGDGTEVEPPGTHVDYSLFPKDRNGSRTRYQRYDKKRGKYDLASLVNKDERRLRRHRKRLRELDKAWQETVLAEREPAP